MVVVVVVAVVMINVLIVLPDKPCPTMCNNVQGGKKGVTQQNIEGNNAEALGIYIRPLMMPWC